MEGVPEEFIDVYEKIRHMFENVSGRDADADLKDPIRSTCKLFAPTIDITMTMLELVENKIQWVAVKFHVHTLKLELRFLITAFRCMVKWCFEDGMQERFMDMLGPIQCQFVRANEALDLYVQKKSFNEVETLALDAVVCNMLENIKIIKPKIKEAYDSISSQPSPYKYPMSVELLLAFIYQVIDALGVVLISYYGAFPSLPKQFLTVGEKLQFLAEFIWFTKDRGLDGVKLKEILISAETLAEKAVGYSDFLWISSEVGLRHIDSETIQPFHSPIFHDFEVGFSNFLGDNLILLLEDETLMKVRSTNEIVALHEEVGLLKDLLSYQLILYPEQKEVIVDGLARRIGSVIGSPFHYENAAAETSPWQQELLETLKCVKAEFQEVSSNILTRQKSKFPKVALMGFIDFFLEEMKELISTKPDIIIDLKDQIMAIQGELDFCRSSLQDIANLPAGDAKLDDVVDRITVAAYEAEHIISLMLIRDHPAWDTCVWISDFTEQVKLIKSAVGEINMDTSSDKRINIAEKDRSHAPSQLLAPTDVVVGFKDEMELLKERLARGPEQLDIVSIVGMPGLGKTTLAKRVYEDPLIVEHFYVRGWCYVSPYFSMNEMLLSILSSVIKNTDAIRKMEDEKLSEMLYKQLKGRRYLIVMDDVWGMDALDAVKRFFPDDGIGSRIMLTSRNKFIGFEAKRHSDPIELRLLTKDESWDLLKWKVFHKEICPLQLEHVGKQIAKKCNGLPLAVVVVAGLLARSDKMRGLWEQVLENLSSRILDNAEGQGMEALELSYKLLPDHLKPLFLYLGAFSVDKVIPVRKLAWLWMAEGFVQKTKLERLEDEAERNLMDLIDRSLVIIGDRRWDGRVKTCRVHDLLRDLCLAKAKEENFLQQIHVERLLPDPSIFEHRRISIHRKGNYNTIHVPYSPTMRSIFLSIGEKFSLKYLHNLKLLRVLDMEGHAEEGRLFDDLIVMVNLRYLSFRSFLGSIPSSIVNLWNLETLILQGGLEISVPKEIWKMAKLKHLHINDRGKFILDERSPQNTSKLLNLETFSTPLISIGEEKKLMPRVPNVRKLRCIFLQSQDSSDMCPVIFPDQLESLNARSYLVAKYRCEFDLPLTLKKLTLSKFHLRWNVISSFQKLPNLEILELVHVAFESVFWDMGDGDFPKLKFLKMEGLYIKQWNASSHNFPCLEQLVLRNCYELVKIPSSLGDICSLKYIAVEWCSDGAVKSAKLIQDEQEDAGNDLLEVHIYPSYDQ